MYSPPAGQGGRRKQSRIVINVDDRAKKQGAGRAVFRRMGRGGRLLSVAGLAALVLLLVLLVVGLVWWQSYKKGPSYSLALLVDAARRDDGATVEQLLDGDRVAQSLAPQVLDKALASAGGMGSLPAPRRQIEAALPNLLSGMREQVRAEVAGGVKEAAAQSRAGSMPFFLLALMMPFTTDIVPQGPDTATVALTKGENRTTELTLKQEGERWRVVGIRDDELAAGIAARVVGGLSAPTAAPPPRPQNGTRRRTQQR